MPHADKVLIEKNVEIPMRDGVVARADLYRPYEGAPTAAIMTRTPYDKEQTGVAGMPINMSPVKLAERGYAALVVDCRGRFASDGEFTPFVNEGNDGYDALEWAALQPWCNGKTAIYGPSYIGCTTMSAARERPPSLKCAIPIITSDDYYDGWTYQGGAFQLGFATTWGTGLAVAQYLGKNHDLPPEGLQTLMRAANDPNGLTHRPLASMPGISEYDIASWWTDWIHHDSRSDYWEATRHSADFARFEIPMLHVGGWFDIFTLGTIRNYRGLNEAANAPQHLLMGPWAHVYHTRYLGEMDFGSTGAAAMAGVVQQYNRFLDTHLRETPKPIDPVRYFLMGANEWRTARTWPPEEAQRNDLYLASNGKANSRRGDGALTGLAPDGSSLPDRYLYDPQRPVSTNGGALLQESQGLPGPRDQRAIEDRDDVLCYSSAVLTDPLTVAGPISVTLWAATDAPDTDWTAKLVDVHPDGLAVSLTDSIVRARFRDGFGEAKLLPGNVPHEFRIDLASTAHRFGAGHRVRVEISSSNFPRFYPNANTGGVAATDTEVRTAVQTVYHDSEHPSHISLWTLPK
ncbi:MAG: CocE/NonD family hydrolase [Gammaproteobacteria bacterium]|nr:CocE/NonD family hydrolase [Gammaproteobacteria bacterium]